MPGEFDDVPTGTIDNQGGATANIDNITLLKQIAANPNTLQGWGSSLSLQMKKIAEAVGIPTEGAAPTQVFQSLMNKYALDARSTAAGGGMPGAMSDADRVFLQQIAGGTPNTPEANLALLDIKLKMEQRKAQVGRLARNYALNNNGRLDLGFEPLIEKWAEAHPMFTDKDVASIFGKSAPPKPETPAATGAAAEAAPPPGATEKQATAPDMKSLPAGQILETGPHRRENAADHTSRQPGFSVHAGLEDDYRQLVSGPWRPAHR